MAYPTLHGEVECACVQLPLRAKERNDCNCNISIGPADVPGAWGFLFSIWRIPICLQAKYPYILRMYGYSPTKSPHCQHFFSVVATPGLWGPAHVLADLGSSHDSKTFELLTWAGPPKTFRVVKWVLSSGTRYVGRAYKTLS